LSFKLQGQQNASADVPRLPAPDILENLPVTKNLFIALRYLRRSDISRILWIYAICIHQDDEQERSAEVGRIGLIYSKVAQTIVWLGPASETSDLAIETLWLIGQDITYHSESHNYDIAKDSQTAKLEDEPGAIAAKAPEWKAIQALLYRD
jgi:hypothetical protein